MDQEQVVLEIDPRSVHQAILQANKDVDDWEKGVVGAGERMQKSLERMADLLVKTNDRSYTSMERLTQSIERQAAMYAKNPVDRLIAERDRWIKKLGDEQAMVDRVTKAYGEMIDIASKKEGGGGGFEAFGQSVKEFIENPLEGAKEAASGLMEKMGPMGWRCGWQRGGSRRFCGGRIRSSQEPRRVWSADRERSLADRPGGYPSGAICLRSAPNGAGRQYLRAHDARAVGDGRR